MSVKDKIQASAISLFNEKGFSSVTMRQLAEALQMSPGNLTYHYKTKKSLIELIYKKMHEEASNYIVTEGYITLHDFELMMERFHGLMKRYRFFFNEVVHIIRQFPEVKKMYEASNLIRFEQGRKLINYYVESGRMKPESLFVDYNKLVHNIWMISAFWSSQDQVITTPTYQVNQTTPVAMVMQLIIPHLTEKGLEEYQQIKKFVK
ncbi:TetR/AcrR family transcriptional regulator [Tenacibaculum sp. M341]|uniref:TetR/AcrR family transcriptional regulator n=1 Tax=Tenacibaculum sp. M341 TaxID=2530339 RepID=UPI0010486194|nr:TetR/AcrR family transcriptional regulator [Tenacibaculum sp. M341]TCI91431.1 TetR/AcrR family transcriptional regulator [Tenacibaculum sp. M341]